MVSIQLLFGQYKVGAIHTAMSPARSCAQRQHFCCELADVRMHAYSLRTIRYRLSNLCGQGFDVSLEPCAKKAV